MFLRVSMGCQFAGTRVSVDSIFQMVPGGIAVTDRLLVIGN